MNYYDPQTMFDNPYKMWPDSDLEKAHNQIEQVLQYRNSEKIAKEISELNINGITVKDFVVILGPLNEDEDPLFSFYIVYGGKIYDLIEDDGKWNAKDVFEFHHWWPTVNEENESAGLGFTSQNDDGKRLYNAAFKFIPPGFSECCENCYEYGSDFKKGIEVLKKHGFTTIIEASLEDQGNYQEVYDNYQKIHNAWIKKNETV